MSDGIDWLFGEFRKLYGARLADMWMGKKTTIEDVREGFREALKGYSMGEVKAGLLACKAKPWPPTQPEFLLLCRPVADLEGLFVSAQQQISRREFGEDHWPSRAVYWAAVEFGFFDMRNAAWQTAKQRWTRILTEKMSREDGLLDIPEPMLALPAMGQTKTDTETAKRHLAALKLITKK